jgi:hypothetical protein
LIARTTVGGLTLITADRSIRLYRAFNPLETTNAEFRVLQNKRRSGVYIARGLQSSAP